MRVELSLNVNYLPGWDSWCGIREIIQNGRDASVLTGGKLTVTHKNGTLIVENAGSTLAHEDLLLGTTSKAGQDSAVGKWGEGLKVGSLALVRAGHKVVIRTGGEVWTPKVERSEKFKADVLVFHIDKAKVHHDRVRVEVGGVDFETWSLLRDRFLFLAKLDQGSLVETVNGSIILDEAFTGRLYVKGFYVQEVPGAVYGYDLQNVDLDRDRRTVSDFDFHWESARVWEVALKSRPDLLDPFFILLNKPGVEDVKGFESSFHAVELPKEVVDEAAKRFAASFGSNALPVQNLGQSQKVEHLGKRGVIVSAPLGAILARTFGKPEDAEKKLMGEALAKYAWGDLDLDAQIILRWACGLMDEIESGDILEKIDIVDFRTETIRGQVKDGRILLAKWLFEKERGSPELALRVLIHEQAHLSSAAGDGEKGHVARIEELWEKVLRHMRSRG